MAAEGFEADGHMTFRLRAGKRVTAHTETGAAARDSHSACLLKAGPGRNLATDR